MLKGTEVDLIYKVQTGENSSGDPTTSSRTIQNINPALEEDNALDIAKSVAGLQEFPFINCILRTDKELADA